MVSKFPGGSIGAVGITAKALVRFRGEGDTNAAPGIDDAHGCEWNGAAVFVKKKELPQRRRRIFGRGSEEWEV